ncbi:hypothetical protein LVY72_02970 [Arthrobacter sp. I2-34]|uniref:Uncharacterized protein n=1 Tax=Arthrobacter hankyongi TaxID=2904801 RepID=A0ABS9L2J9_9MICC|nr:hypothetical protein [Arthrobacter hankyongi]MCG2620873.1 hypothetical protein [Arthrobacter hankyongi]
MPFDFALLFVLCGVDVATGEVEIAQARASIAQRKQEHLHMVGFGRP